MPPADPWFPFVTRQPAGARRLFAFPFAGGGASAFRSLAADLAPRVEVWACQLPGRETRLREPLVDDMETLLDALLPALRPHLQGRFAFYGHSLGAQVAHALARRLDREGGPLPAVLFAAACGAPHLPRARRLHDLPEDAFRAELARMGGTPRAVLEDAELMELFLPVLRADMALSERHVAPVDPLPVPLEVLAGADDDEVDAGRLAAWGAQTTAGCTVHVLPGDHFLLATARDALAERIARRLS